jgi:trans-aconitate methyltransferase
MAHKVIVGYIKHIRDCSAVLDGGCGKGLLAELLHGFGFERYLGIDFSSHAIRKANRLSIANASFELADFDDWEGNMRFNIIVFNEVVYYAKRPVDLLSRYTSYLKDNGSMIVSMVRVHNNQSIWERIGKRFPVIHTTSVENHQGVSWDIRVVQPKLS